METTAIMKFMLENGAYGLLLWTNFLLWIKIDKKDEKIYNLIEELAKLNQSAQQTNKTLDQLSGTLLSLLTNKK
jgi:hypothetical protein